MTAGELPAPAPDPPVEPPSGAELWRGLFGNARPVSIEIGPGRGEFLFAIAAAEPAHNFFAIERSGPRYRDCRRRLARTQAPNVRLLHADAACVVRTLVPKASVARYFIQFPDPWWKRRHKRRRLMDAGLVAALGRTLVPGGTVEFATDVGEYFAVVEALFADAPRFHRLAAADAIAVETNFAGKAQRRGAAIRRAVFRYDSAVASAGAAQRRTTSSS